MIESSSEEEEEETVEQHQNIEFITTTTIDTSVQEAEVLAQDARYSQAPPMEMPSPTTTEAFPSEPIVSQAFIESQMRQLSKSIITSIGSMFEKLNQSVDYRF